MAGTGNGSEPTLLRATRKCQFHPSHAAARHHACIEKIDFEIVHFQTSCNFHFPFTRDPRAPSILSEISQIRDLLKFNWFSFNVHPGIIFFFFCSDGIFFQNFALVKIRLPSLYGEYVKKSTCTECTMHTKWKFLFIARFINKRRKGSIKWKEWIFFLNCRWRKDRCHIGIIKR